MVYSSSGGASLFYCIGRARACIAFTFFSVGVNVGGFIA